MKAIKILFATVVVFITSQAANAQTGKETLNDRTKTQTVKVYGECGMCKKRIEKAASTIPGVQSVSWNEFNKMLTIKYDLFKKDAVNSVQKKLADVGHDTEKYRAEDAAYQELPDCCHYQRKQ